MGDEGNGTAHASTALRHWSEGATRFGARPVSIIVTTYATDTLYTQACLESIRRWKGPQHELIVVTHDESPLLRAYLNASAADGLIDRLVYAESGHGHTRSFNLGVEFASSDVLFNICNDITIGPSLVDHCAEQLRRDPQLGIVGWHWFNEGTFWQAGQVHAYTLRDARKPDLSPTDEANVRNAPWFTGRFFNAVNGPKCLHLCNTSFFGIRRDVLNAVGGGFSPRYPHFWADDFLNYAVLDQGLDIRHFPAVFRHPNFFHEIQNTQTDVPDRRRHSDTLRYDGPFLDFIRLINGGMSENESVFLHLLARSIPDGATVTNVGCWRGSSAIVLLDALRSKRIRFHFIDCFDLAGISAMSGQQPGVSREEFVANVTPYVRPEHSINIVRANTLDLGAFPRSDFIFVDAGHTRECISHDSRLARECLTSRGVAAFHDYGYPGWPEIRPVVDQHFPNLRSYETIAVHRACSEHRERYDWARFGRWMPVKAGVSNPAERISSN